MRLQASRVCGAPSAFADILEDLLEQNMDQLGVRDAQMYKMFLLLLVFEFATCFHPVCATSELAKRF